MSVQDYLRVRRAVRDLPGEAHAASAEFLRRQGVRAVPALVRALEATDEALVTATARLLCEIGDARALGPLGRLVLRDAQRSAEEAAAGLWRLAHPLAARLLGHALGSRHETVRVQAALSLARLAARTDDADSDARKAAQEASRCLGLLAPSDVAAVCRALIWRLDGPAREAAFAAALHADPVAAIDTLLAAVAAPELTDENAVELRALFHRAECVWPLIRQLNSATAPTIMPLLAEVAASLRESPEAAAARDTIAHTLVGWLDPEAPETAQLAIAALHHLGEWAHRALSAELQRAAFDERPYLADVLDALGWRPARDAATACYLIARRRWDEAAQLGREAEGPLVEAWLSGDLEAREAAARRLLALRWQPDEQSTRAQFLVTLRRWPELAVMGQPASRALAQSLQQEREAALATARPHQRAEVRAAMVGTLAKLGGPDAAAALVDSLRADPSRLVRDAALAAIEGLGAEAVSALIEATQQELARSEEPSGEASVAVRCELVQALARLRAHDALDVLVRALTHDPSPVVRASAGHALYLLALPAPERAVSALTAALEGTPPSEVGDVLRRIGAPAWRRLLFMINGLDPRQLRRAVAGYVALGRVGGDVITPLSESLRSGSMATRRAVVEILDRLARMPEDPATQAAYWLARGELSRCEQLGQHAVPVLVQALSVYDWRTAGAVVCSLVRLGLDADDPALAPTIAKLEEMAALPDDRLIQPPEPGGSEQTPVSLEVSQEPQRQAARELLAAIHRAEVEQLRGSAARGAQ